MFMTPPSFGLAETSICPESWASAVMSDTLSCARSCLTPLFKAPSNSNLSPQLMLGRKCSSQWQLLQHKSPCYTCEAAEVNMAWNAEQHQMMLNIYRQHLGWIVLAILALQVQWWNASQLSDHHLSWQWYQQHQRLWCSCWGCPSHHSHRVCIR